MDIQTISRHGHVLTYDGDGVYLIHMDGWPTDWVGRDRVTACRLWRDVAFGSTADLADATADVDSLV